MPHPKWNWAARSDRAGNKDAAPVTDHDTRTRPVSTTPAIALAEVKELLRRFTSERRSWAPDAAALELGELVLCLMQHADHLGVDLVTAGEAQLQRAVANVRAAAPAQPLSLVWSSEGPPGRQ